MAQKPDISELRPFAVVVNDSASTIRINDYKWDTGSVLVPGNVQETVVKHTAKYESINQRNPVSAVELGFVIINAWNELVAHHVVTDIDIGVLNGEKTVHATSRTGSYEAARTFACFVYVSRVRFGNGDIWVSDRSAIREGLAKYFTLELPEEVGEALEATDV